MKTECGPLIVLVVQPYLCFPTVLLPVDDASLPSQIVIDTVDDRLDAQQHFICWKNVKIPKTQRDYVFGCSE